jgi:hypothetical protein
MEDVILNKKMEAFPLGSITADGWLRKLLELQRDNLTGDAEKLFAELGSNSAWLGGDEPQSDWERPPYYVKGLAALAYTLQDEGLISKLRKWIEWTLSSQRTDGYFGPESNDDWWPRMPMLYALRDYFQATGDGRVPPFMINYFRYQLEHLPQRPLYKWAKARAGDNMELALWLYELTKETFLLKLIHLLHDQSYPWTDIYSHNRFLEFGDDFLPKHAVNVAQAIKMPVIYYRLSGREENRQAFLQGHEHLMRVSGQVLGMSAGTEFHSSRSASDGIELCAIVERMQSLETAMEILGVAAFGDQLERLAFNALPGAMLKDLKGYQYYTVANQPVGCRGLHGYIIDYQDGLLQGPDSGCHCCNFNWHMGWPYYVKQAWMRTENGGVAVAAYGPSTLNVDLQPDVHLVIAQTTSYPFREAIEFDFRLSRPALFEFKLRIPAWCGNPVVKVNSQPITGIVPGEFLAIVREWRTGDHVSVLLPMTVSITRWVNHSAAVERGPLVYALNMKEERHAYLDKGHGYSDYEMSSTTPWNYAIELSNEHMAHGIDYEEREMNDYPFARPPVLIRVPGRRLPSWTISHTPTLALDPPYSPVATDEPLETLQLVPFGCQNLKIACFPVTGEPEPVNRGLRIDFSIERMEDWVTYGGAFGVIDGELCAVSNYPTGAIHGPKAILAGTKYCDFVYEATVRIHEGAQAGLIFRVGKPMNGADSYDGYFAGLDAVKQRLVVGKASGKWEELAWASTSVLVGEKYRIKVVAQGARIEVFLNDGTQPLATVVDNDFPVGMIGVRAYNAVAGFSTLMLEPSLVDRL